MIERDEWLEDDAGGPMAGDVRLVAWECLRSPSTVPLRELDAIADEYGLERRDRALARRLVTTVFRRLGTLRALTAGLATRRPKPDLAAFVHLGLAQLYFLDRVPDHAAVGETVAACNRALDLPRGRFANAVLRRAIRERHEGHTGDPRRDLIGTPWRVEQPFARDPDEHPFLWYEDALSIPSRLAKAWDNRYGAETARRLAEVSLIEPPLSVRIVAGDPESLAIELELDDLHPIASHGSTLLFDPATADTLLSSAAFKEGRVTVQGGTATRAAELVGAVEGERILDLCAAPGGKTAVLAGAGARVVACDVEPGKLERLQSTLERLGLAERVELCLSDGTRSVGEAGFDAVLVDAPCSNTGVLAARPEARWRYQPATLNELQGLQARLLREGAARVRKGGRLVWSTCSLEPSENTGQVKAFVRDHPEWSIEEEFEELPDPRSGPIDGGYAARLRHGADR